MNRTHLLSIAVGGALALTGLALSSCEERMVQVDDTPAVQQPDPSSAFVKAEVVPDVTCGMGSYTVRLVLTGYEGPFQVYGMDLEIPPGLELVSIEDDGTWTQIGGIFWPDRIRLGAWRDEPIVLHGEEYGFALVRLSGQATTSSISFTADVFTDDLLGFPRRHATCLGPSPKNKEL